MLMPLLKLDSDGVPVPLSYQRKRTPSRAIDSRPTRAPELGSARWKAIRSRVLTAARRRGDVCHLCGRPEVRGHKRWGFSVDHLIARADGGDDVASNLAVAHLGCNASKGQR